MTRKIIKVFFGCSIRGGHELVSLEELQEISNIIESLGYQLVSKHQTESGIIAKEDLLPDTQIHDRDYRWIIEVDVGIFEITNHSTGAGCEISDMIHLGKPVLCLYKRALEKSVSSYAKGKQGSVYVKTPFSRYAYIMIAEIKPIIKQFIEKHC